MIVVVGLGNMGSAVAERLVKTGHHVVAVDLAQESREAWTTQTGLEALPSLELVDWTAVEHVVVLVRLTSQAEIVLTRIGELTEERSLPVYLMTTLDMDFARDLDHRTFGSLRVLETPISGGDHSARSGTLTVMVAGPSEADDLNFLTSTVAANLESFKYRSHPTLVKLINNVAAAYNALTLAELLVVADEHGLDPHSLRRVLSTASGGSWITPQIENLIGDLLIKDTSLLAGHVGDLPVVSLADQHHFVARLEAARSFLAVDTQPGGDATADDTGWANDPAKNQIVSRSSTRLSYADCDPAGIVYYAAWFPMAERVLSEWFLSAGYRFDTMREQVGAAPVTRATTCDYLASARVYDLVDIGMSVEHVGVSSYRLGFLMTRTEDATALAWLTISCVMLSEGVPVPLPPPIRELLNMA